MSDVRITGYGARGLAGVSLAPEVVMNLVSAFATFLDGGSVLLARDTRDSSEMFRASVRAALLGCGCEVLEMGVCPTPILQFMTSEMKADGAIAISGGHHPQGWNSITLFDQRGAFLNPAEGEAVLELMRSGEYRKAKWSDIGTVHDVDASGGSYFEKLCGFLDVDAISAQHFKVVIDPVCGAACSYIDSFAALLGLEVVTINGSPSGYLPREAEPRPRSAIQLASVIQALESRVGFLLSSDASRMSLVSELGEPLSEELTFAIIARHFMKRNQGTVVTNCCTTSAVDDCVMERGGHVVKTRVGQPFITASMMDEGAVLAGEGNGSVCVPAFSNAFDGFMMMGLILEAMAQNQATLSELRYEIPAYSMAKRQIECDSQRGYQAVKILLDEVRAEEGREVDTTDGVRISDTDGWVHVRVSHTQNMIRIIAESRQADDAEQRAREMERKLRRYC